MIRTSELTERVDIEGVIAGETRLSCEDALYLYENASIHELGRWADAVCRRIHGDEVRTYVIDRNVNYTNVCSANCTFCAFKRDLGHDEAYVLNRDELRKKIAELVKIGGTQVLLQGGMHPELQLSFYEEMLTWLGEEFPSVHPHAFSPPEFVEFVAVFDIDGFPTPGPNESHTLAPEVWKAKLDVIFERLMKAGLKSLPGGGGEILVEHVRWRIGAGKATGEQWLNVMKAAHQRGMFTSATMMFGHIEGIADRVMHMEMIRKAQDEAIENDWAGRYLSFISWPFQPENTSLGRLKKYDTSSGEPFAGDVLAEKIMRGEVDGHDRRACKEAVPNAGRELRLSCATDYLRMQALSRLFFDNIHSIGSSWVTMGPLIGQLGLYYGANDMGSVMMEENVVSSAGTTFCLNEADICRLIRDAGFVPGQRDNAYRILRKYENDGPDTGIKDWSHFRPAISAFNQPEEEKTVDVTVGEK